MLDARRRYVRDIGAVTLLGLGTPLSADPAVEAAALSAAEAWLAKIDSGRAEASWEDAAPIVHDAVSADDWALAIGAIRGPVGRMTHRRLVSKERVEAPPPTALGRCVVFRFATVFERRPATEILTLTCCPDSKWRAAAYFLK